MDWLLGVSPILLIALVCPLMMIFMMRGMHGGHGAATEHDDHNAGDEDPERRLAQLEEEIHEPKQRIAARPPADAAPENRQSTVRHV